MLMLLLCWPASSCTPQQAEALERIAADPFTFAAPGGESQQELEARICAFVHRQLLPSLQYGGPPAVVVTHGLAIKWCVGGCCAMVCLAVAAVAGASLLPGWGLCSACYSGADVSSMCVR